MQILQSGPSQATLRQQAMDQGMNNLVSGLGKYEDAKNERDKTLRQQAMQLGQARMDLQKMGYDTTKLSDDQIAAGVGIQKPAEIGFRSLFSKQDQPQANPQNLFSAPRTEEWNDKQGLEKAKYAREMRMSDLDEEYKKSHINSMYADNKKKLAEANDLASGNKFHRELVQGQQKKLSEDNAKLFNVRNGMTSALKQLEDPNLSEEDKVKVGQGLLKLLNSAEGSDAVGAEEAKRIGSYLEYKMGNFTQPGSIWGRDLDKFTEQVRNNANLLGDRIRSNEQGISSLSSGQALSQIAQPIIAPKSPTNKFNTNTATAGGNSGPWSKYGKK